MSSSSRSPAEILASASKENTLELNANLPRADSLKKVISRVRNKTLPKFMPTRLQDLVEHDFDEGSQKVLIFSTDDNMEYLKKCEQWYADGTFKSAPPLFDQLFVIQGKKSHSALIPLVYCLMSNRTERAHDIVFEFLADKLGDFEPQNMMSDFEVASRNSFSTFYPSVEQRGCFFTICRQYGGTFSGTVRFTVAISVTRSSHFICDMFQR
jgi:hypothetical protein